MHTTTEAYDPAGNRLLASLPREDYERLLPHLGAVTFSLGEVVYESGGKMEHIYFPTTAIISLLYMMENGSSAEMEWRAKRGWSASRSSWAAAPCRTAPSCRARAGPSR